MSMVVEQERSATARMRGRLFWVLAEGVLLGVNAPSWSMFDEAEAGDAVAADSPLSAAWRDLVRVVRALNADDRLRLEVEHTRLCAGLKEGDFLPPPFESAWRTGAAPGEIAREIENAYAGAGFAEIDMEAGPQDHLAVELKFMALLALKEAEAVESGDAATARARMNEQKAFLERHLLGWVPRWTDALAHGTQEPMYWALAGMIGALLSQTLEDLLAEEVS
jgi:TorA maturation chaperone TorD